MAIRRVVISAASGREQRRWQSVDDLCCPVCRRPVRAEPPGYWRVADGPVPAWSHRDGRALCRIQTDDGIRFAKPIRRAALASQRRAALPDCTRRSPGQGAERVARRPGLAELGVLDMVRRGGAACTGTVSRWATRDFVVRPAILDPWGGGWIVDREWLDALLVEAAVRDGARLVHGRAVAVQPRHGGADVLLHGGGDVGAGMVVVAAGRAGRLASGPSPRVRQRMAILTVDLPGGAVPDLHQQLLVDRAPGGWWYALASGNLTTLGFCTDGHLVGSGRTGALDAWHRACRTVNWLPARAHRHTPRVRSHTVAAGRGATAGAVLAGDAALSVDPLSGHGIALAIEAAARWTDPGYHEWLAAVEADELARERDTYRSAHGADVSRFWARRTGAGGAG